MSAPFMVFGLPRSCTAWFSTLLSLGSRVCYHEIETQCATIEEFYEKIEGNGNASTVVWKMLPELLERFPNMRYVWLRKDLEECNQSLLNLGLKFDFYSLQTIASEAEQLGAMSQLVADVDVLHMAVARSVWEHLLPDEKFPMEKVKNLLRMNVRLTDWEFKDVSTRPVRWLMEVIA